MLSNPLPVPSGNFVRLCHNVTRRVVDGGSAIAGEFDDVTLDDVNDRGAIAMAMPGNDATRLDGELAHAEFAVLDLGRLFRDVDHGDHGVGDTDGLHVDGLAGIRLLGVGGALTGERGGRERAGRQGKPSHNNAATKPSSLCQFQHLRYLLWLICSAEGTAASIFGGSAEAAFNGNAGWLPSR